MNRGEKLMSENSLIHNNPKLTNVDLVVYALYLCGGVEKRIHTEHVANQCYELLPERFSWRLYKFPDKVPAKVALYDAMKEEYGKLVSGRAGTEAKGKDLDGWVITPGGVKWIKANQERIAQALKQPIKRTSIQERETFRKRILESAAYKQFASAGIADSIKDFEFADLLRCSPDAPGEIMRKKFQALLRKAEDVESGDVLKFLNVCGQRFKSLLER
jgi:hypothetical protein